jgi:hypothetical protein
MLMLMRMTRGQNGDEGKEIEGKSEGMFQPAGGKEKEGIKGDRGPGRVQEAREGQDNPRFPPEIIR